MGAKKASVSDLVRSYYRKVYCKRRGKPYQPITQEERAAVNKHFREQRKLRPPKLAAATNLRTDIALHSQYQFLVRNKLTHLITDEMRKANAEYHRKHNHSLTPDQRKRRQDNLRAFYHRKKARKSHNPAEQK